MSQPLKTNKSYNGDIKWIKYNSPKRNAAKRYKLSSLSQVVQNLSFFRGLNQNHKLEPNQLYSK